MSGKTNKLISQEGKKDYGEEAAEDTKEISQGDDKFDGGDDEFEEARAEEITFDRACAEEIAARARSQKARSMSGYKTGTSNNTEEEEEEKNVEGNRKQPVTNPIGGSLSWEKESAARARSERAGNLSEYATGLANEPEEEEEEEYAAGNCKQPARNPIGLNQGWENENEPMSSPCTLGIHGGAAGIFTKQATMLPEEGNKKMQEQKQEHYTGC